MLIKKLLQLYLRLGQIADGAIYRSLGIFSIYFYRVLIRPGLSRRCQFKTSCSEFTLRNLRDQKDFQQLETALSQRYEDCSAPLNWRFSSAKGVIATAQSHRIYGEQELSDHFLEEVQQKIAASGPFSHSGQIRVR